MKVLLSQSAEFTQDSKDPKMKRNLSVDILPVIRENNDSKLPLIGNDKYFEKSRNFGSNTQ